MKPNTKRYNIMTLPIGRTSLIVGDLCSNKSHKAFVWTKEHFRQHRGGTIGVEYKETVPQYLYAIDDNQIGTGDKNFYFIELDLKETRSSYANKLHYCDIGVTDNFILTSTTNFPFPENCRKVVASNNEKVTPESLIPQSYIEYYAEKAIDSGVPIDYIYLETEELPDIMEGERLMVNSDFPTINIKKGDFIVVAKVDGNMVHYMEGGIREKEIHFSHLTYLTTKKPIVDEQGFVSVDYADDNDKIYSKYELRALMLLTASTYYEVAIIDKQLKQLKALPELKKHFNNWFNKFDSQK